MITYHLDKEKKYDEEVKQFLRSYNDQFVKKRVFETVYMYAIKNDKVVGYMKLDYVWDWLNISACVYDDISALKDLTDKAFDAYKDRMVGIKTFTIDKNRLKDYIELGYILDGSFDLTHEITYYYMSLFEFDKPLKNNQTIIVSETPVEPFQSEADLKLNAYNQLTHQDEEGLDYDLVALDQNHCVGGVQATIYHDMIYVNRLSVNERYRKKQIGSTLMQKVIDHARKLNLPFVMLSTTSFQAKTFYEKLGFSIVYTRKNHPLGYDAYTLLKRL